MAWNRESLADVVAKHGCTATDTPVTRRIKALIREDYERGRTGDHRPGPYVTHAGKCQQRLYWELTDEPKTQEISDDSLINFKVGHIAEEMLSEVLANGAHVIRERKVTIDYHGVPIAGRIDFLITFPDSREMWELKTTKSSQMTWMVKNNEHGQDEHRRQINLYLHASHLGLLDHVYDVGHVIYVIKDATVGQPNIFDFEVPYDQFMAEGDLAWMVHHKRRADAGDPPGIPLEYLSKFEKKGQIPYFPCAHYCEWRDRCWPNGKPATFEPAAQAS